MFDGGDSDNMILNVMITTITIHVVVIVIVVVLVEVHMYTLLSVEEEEQTALGRQSRLMMVVWTMILMITIDNAYGLNGGDDMQVDR